MSERESWRAGRDAGREAKAHPERPTRQEETLRYLAAGFYAEQRGNRRAAAPSAGVKPAAVSGLVVVGVDGSAGSVAALDQAAAEASLRGWPLLVRYVLPWAVDVALAASRDRAAALVATMADRARALTTTPVTGEVSVGSAVDALVEQSANASLLVLGSRGMGPVKGVVNGSVSTRVVAAAMSPVMVVPPSFAPPEQPRTPSIVVGVDGSAESEAAAEFAVEEARARGAALMAIRACTEAPGSDVLSTGALDPAHTIDIAVLRRYVRTDAAHALIDASEHASAIVVGTRGRGGVRGVRVGSISQALMRRAHCPVIIVPRRPEEGSAPPTTRQP